MTAEGNQSPPGEAGLEEFGLSEAELAALALAADPRAPLDPDALPIDLYLGCSAASGPSLPAWYMAPSLGRPARRRWLLPVVVVVVTAFVLINAFGLCNTYGVLGL